MSGPYVDDGMAYMETMEPYPPNFSRHHPSCSCHQCRNKRQVPTPALPSAYSDKYSDVPNDRTFNYHNNPGPFGTREFNHSISNPPPKVLSKKKSRKKMRCEACSTVFFTVSDKKLVISIDVEVEDNPVEVDKKHNVLSTHVDGHLNQTRTTFSSDDYDNSGYDFHSMDRETRQMSPEHQGRANKSTEIKSRNSLSTYTSEAEEDRESLRSRRKDSSSIDLSTKDKGPPPPAGSSLQDYFEYSNKYHAVNRPGEGNRREPSEHDRLLPNKTTTRQISRKESSATEIDLSSNEYFNTGTTLIPVKQAEKETVLESVGQLIHSIRKRAPRIQIDPLNPLSKTKPMLQLTGI
ncbi:UNVERIFIED_CONTAM: hypothetical protein Sangu_0006300 [Sesamum angustifolium]|uniref:Uncharacterized protein n=1 Tax=Sesamum angustifolium TaxID=2727405 RepID=A0AAW2RHG4_9LAMI